MLITRSRTSSLAALVLSVLATPAAQATTIGASQIVAIPAGVTGSGNGTLDLRMATFSGSEITNTAGSFNFDNGNNTLPQGGGADTSSFAESYVITAGELQSYYNLNFGATGAGQVQLVLFLDLNETGGGQANNTLAVLDIFLNPATIQGSPNPSGDVTSAQQAAINQVFTGGTLLAELSPEPAANIPVNNQGAGFADYAIATGIDPFALNASDVVLFNFSMNTLNNGAEEFFLSGTFAGSDIPDLPPIPEPGTGLLLGAGLAVFAAARARRDPARPTS
jgi:PEP-CTERM motif-containing protein